MDTTESIKNQIIEDWGEKPQSHVCLSILNYLLRVPSKQLSHITYGSIRNVVDRKFQDSDLLIAIQYLSGDRTKLLDVEFELIDENDNVFPLPSSEVKIAQETGELIHPENGEAVNNYEDKVFMYFKPSSLVISINN